MSLVTSNSELLDRLIADMAADHASFVAIVEAMLSSSFDSVIMSDGYGFIQCWNERAAKLFGYEEEEVRTLVLTDLVPVRYRRRHSAAIADMNHEGSVSFDGKDFALGSACVSGLHKNGTEIPVNIRIGSYRAKSGAAHHVAFIQRAGERTYSGSD